MCIPCLPSPPIPSPPILSPRSMPRHSPQVYLELLRRISHTYYARHCVANAQDVGRVRLGAAAPRHRLGGGRLAHPPHHGPEGPKRRYWRATARPLRQQCVNQPLKCNLHILLFPAKKKKRAAREKNGGYYPWRAQRANFFGPIALFTLGARSARKFLALSPSRCAQCTKKRAVSALRTIFLRVFGPFFTKPSLG